MSAVVIDLALKLWPYILGVLGAAFGAWKIYAAGKASERAKQDRARQKARDVADEVDNDVGAMPPDRARKELSTWDM